MASTKITLGKYIERLDNRNIDLKFGFDDVCGVSNNKDLMPTKADISDRDLTKFRIIFPGDFVYNHRTSRHGGKFCISYNSFNKPMICTEDYTVFRIKDEAKSKISPVWLFIFFNRPEFDRFVMYSSWGSSTEFFNWEDVQNIEIELPSIDIQNKYVNVYLSMILNQKSYERGLFDLKLTCDAYIEELRRKMTCEKIGNYLHECNEKNENDEITLFQGVNVEHVFTDPKRIAEDSENGAIVRTGQFAFNKVMKANGTKLPIALREGPDCVVSNSYQVFEITDQKKLIPEYLMLWMNREETQRYAGYISFGTTRDIFSFDDLCEVQIPIPKYELQKSIVDIYKVYTERKAINEKLKSQIKDICPILIKGSLEEAKEA